MHLHPSRPIAVLALLVVTTLVFAQPATDPSAPSGHASSPDAPIKARRENVSSNRYDERQTFGGQSFFRDNNLWVYNAGFAETFGMPKSGIDPGLAGIEAAAF